MTKNIIQKIILLLITLSSLPAFAEFRRAQTMLNKVQTGLTGLSLVTVTIAVIWVGYRVLFGGSTIRECAPIIIGAVIIASAAEISKLLVVTASNNKQGFQQSRSICG